jgi:hypothetical protein
MKFRLIVFAAMALLATRVAHAGIAIDTIDYGEPTNVVGPDADGTSLAAQSFTAANQLDFASISVSLLAASPSDGGSVMVYLVADDGTGGAIGHAGAPDFGNIELIGTIPDSLIADQSTGSPTIFTFFNVINALPSGTVNQEYWLTMDFGTDSSSAEWVYNADAAGIGTANQLAFTDLYGGSYPIDGSIAGPFGVLVETPEPATVALLGGAMAGLGIMRRRKSKTTV